MKHILYIIALSIMMSCCVSRGDTGEDYELTDSAMAAIDSICEDLAKVEHHPIKKYVMPKRLAEECRIHTIEMQKSDSEIYRRGYYFTLLGDSLPMTPYSERKGTIKEVCADCENLTLTDEDIAHLDSTDGGFYLIRNADRTLDTIVNHQRIIFTILP